MFDDKRLPPIVYHYTTMDVLLKVVDSRSIWATNIKYLNDVLERNHCLQRVRERLTWADAKERWGSVSEEVADLNEREYMPTLPFVASFSKDRDSLTQWRSHCPKGNGVCIGFRTESLSKAFLMTNEVSRPDQNDDIAVDFGPVAYLGPDNIRAVEEMIEHATRNAIDWEAANQEFVRAGIKRDIVFWSEIESFASRTKHISFESEQEFRLIAVDSNGFIDAMQFRPSRSTLIPYVKLGLPDPTEFLAGVGHREPILDLPDLPKPYFIDNVTLGPTPHVGLSKDSLDALFGVQNRDVIIHVSEVPYRDW